MPLKLVWFKKSLLLVIILVYDHNKLVLLCQNTCVYPEKVSHNCIE